MKTKDLKQALEAGKYSDLLNDIYLDSTLIEKQTKRYLAAINSYEKLYGVEEDVEIISVPGRSEVGGNHTDHQHGQVLACAINLDIIAIVSKNDNIRVVSDDRSMEVIGLNELSANSSEQRTTRALIKGVINKLAVDGYQIGGFKAYITSDVLIGSGMSSSAAFEVLIGYIISYLYNQGKIDAVEIAKVSQYAENVYFGKPSGLMDQTACSVGGLVHINFMDSNNPIIDTVDVDFSAFNYSLCIVDTLGSHASLTDEYAAIPNEMSKVAHYLKADYISEVSYDKIIDNIVELRKVCGDRGVLRSIHVLQENTRVEQEVKALAQKNFPQFLAVVNASGNSSYKYLQNVYANCDCQNQGISLALQLSEIILGDNGVARVHGGGFAGSIQAFVKNEFVQQYRQQIEHVFGPGTCHVLKVRKYGGMKVI